MDSEFDLRISSFGYKHGICLDANWVVDTRFLRNPFWVPELKPLCGTDSAVYEYVMQQPAAQELVARVSALLIWSRGETLRAGKTSLHLACGCTGGRHRSVAIAEALRLALAESGVEASVRHRDVDRDPAA